MNHTPNLKITGARQVGSPSADAAVAPAHAPSPHAEHRQELPIEPLPEGTSKCQSHSEPVWRGASRMLAGLSAARRLHPAGGARA